MNHIDYITKQNKIKNLILFILFVIFAVLQLNDPDGKLWFSIYFIVSLICLFNTFKPVPKSILILSIIALMSYSVFHFSLFIDYLNTENKKEIFGEMVYDKPYLEGTREFIGLLLAALGIMYQIKIRKFK
ncbi:transmembrane 220 family protein [Flavobacteriaceae bacterium]|nr:transmembrane 220 family protein [Flavobacteriaceae bacterium]MDB4086449.1 transmembrane 220 family protein [Flavobacteriaceae bacterium]MDB9902137.1 transmembrane 220 family protein [Flavobacteriaceae bacterium]